MNNYIKILNFLRPHAGDAKFHNVQHLLDELGLIEEKDKELVIGELSRMNLIIADGGNKGGMGMAIGYSDGTVTHFGGSIWYKEYEAKITLDGLKYLKEEIRMEKEGAYNININGHQNQLVLNSKHVNLNTITKIDQLVEEAVNKLQSLDGIPAKEEHINLLRKFQSEAKQGEVPESTTRKLIGLGSDISSIGSLIISMLGLVLGQH